jgi:polysulfide reductase-like protein
VKEQAVLPEPEFRSYYGRPVIKKPVWKPEVPWYFFAGGLGGASAALAFGADAAGNATLAKRAWAVSLAAISASPVLLIRDLGRPERFFNMLRVFKISSPMSVGSWVLTADGAATAFAAAHCHFGWFPRLNRVAEPSAALLGLCLSTYTAALVANTAIPVWHEARRELPFVFAGSAAASAGAAAGVLTPSTHAGPARRLTAFGALLELGATRLMERRLGWLAEPYHRGEAARFSRLSKSLTVAGAVVVGLRGRSRWAARAGSVSVLAGGALLRWAVFKAGFESASDPRQTVELQRHRAA